MIEEIKNCLECPFCNNDSEYGYSCNIANIGEYDMPSYKDKWVPKECPLLKEEIIVKLKDANITNKTKSRESQINQG